MKMLIRVCISVIVGCLMVGVTIWLVGNAGSAAASNGVSGSILVNTLEDELNDDGDCSLREAIEAANTNTAVDACGAGDVVTDTITFNTTGTIEVDSQLIVIGGGPLTIDGGNAITLSGGGSSAVWKTQPDSQLIIQSMAIMYGYSTDSGAGLFNNDGNVTIVHSTFYENNAFGDGGGAIYNLGHLTIFYSNFLGNYGQWGGCIRNYDSLYIDYSTFTSNEARGGGCIFNDGLMTVNNSTFANNTSIDGDGGAISIEEGYQAIIINSTFSGNTSVNYGGAISNILGSVELINNTFAANIAVFGGGISNYGNINSLMTIIANNDGGDCVGQVLTDLGYNLDSDYSCGFFPANGSLPNTDPVLGPLQDNGGPTYTHALLPSSPAIDAGNNLLCPTTDQRNVSRPIDGDGDNEAICDIGSFETWIAPTQLNIGGENEGFIGETYAFTANVSPVTSTLPITYIWQASGQAPITHTSGLTDSVSFTWDNPSGKLVSVTATNLGGTISGTHVINIQDIPIAGLEANNNSPTMIGETTTFTATITGGTNVSHEWDFGDGFGGIGAVVTHNYGEVGFYTASVTATNTANSMMETTYVIIFFPVTRYYLPVVVNSR